MKRATTLKWYLDFCTRVRSTAEDRLRRSVVLERQIGELERQRTDFIRAAQASKHFLKDNPHLRHDEEGKLTEAIAIAVARKIEALQGSSDFGDRLVLERAERLAEELKQMRGGADVVPSALDCLNILRYKE